MTQQLSKQCTLVTYCDFVNDLIPPNQSDGGKIIKKWFQTYRKIVHNWYEHCVCRLRPLLKLKTPFESKRLCIYLTENEFVFAVWPVIIYVQILSCDVTRVFSLDFSDKRQYFLTIRKIIEYNKFLVGALWTNEQFGLICCILSQRNIECNNV